MLTDPVSFLLFFDELPETRQDAKILYPLHEMIFIAMCATIANCDTWTDIEDWASAKCEFLREYVPLENGISSHDTFSLVLAGQSGRLFRVPDQVG